MPAHGSDAEKQPLIPHMHGHGYASSDDDIEVRHDIVDHYWLESDGDTPVSFCRLPHYFGGAEQAAPEEETEVYLRGKSEDGMCLYVRALAWKLELTNEMKPVFHLKTDKYWTKLLKPRKSYEETIRSILSVTHFLNYAFVNPGGSEKAAWDHVKELFPSWDVEPSRKDLHSHLTIVQHLISSNQRLATSIALQTVDIGLSKKAVIEDGRQSIKKRMYISDGEDDEVEFDHKNKRSKTDLNGADFDEEINGIEENADVDDVGDLSETVCCICDNGGEVTGCDGPCMRSFHVHKDAQGSDDVNCPTLGFSKSKLERMDKFYCPNCEAKVHQCYACGGLGSSDETADAMQEVFVCDAAMCGHFYHPTCAAELILCDKDKSEQIALAEVIREGKGFVCPMHKCWECGKGEVKDERNLQFGICRRCPRVWHRQCFPPSILFDENADDKPRREDQITRAWDGLLQNRVLIYCKRHPMISNLGTPARTHVKFPTSYFSSGGKLSENNKLEQTEKGEKLSNVDSFMKDEDGLKRTTENQLVKLSESVAKRTTTVPSGPNSTKKKHWSSMSKGRSPVLVLRTVSSSTKNAGKLRESFENEVQSNENHDIDVLSREAKVSGVGLKVKPPSASSSQQALQKSKTPLDKSNAISNETRKMVDSIIEKVKASVTLDNILKKHEVPLNYRGANPKTTCRKHSLVRIESIIKGMQKAVETLDNGGSIEDAKMKCSPDLIKYIEICRNDLCVYMSPFLYGARYTSYGRHFTKTEKLEQIAARLHWYLDEGDMVVDFCCGANEFSLLVKQKLDKSGKKCSYKNFDAIQTNNDFHFTKKDWFTVKQEDLVDGSKLIMGLNPPFGVKASRANQFIDHALKFKPKLLVLIVPKETERLDCKREKYELVWEDPDLLEGKSFYLPGSVDANENPIKDWNIIAPTLYLWSRSDWAAKHRQVAVEKGHISTATSTKFVGIDGHSAEFNRQRKVSPERDQTNFNATVVPDASNIVVDPHIHSSNDVKKDEAKEDRKHGEVWHQDHRQISPGMRYENKVHPAKYLDHNARRPVLYNIDMQRKAFNDPLRGLIENHGTNPRLNYNNEYRLAARGQVSQMYGRTGMVNANNYQPVVGLQNPVYGPGVDLHNRYAPGSNPLMGTVGMRPLRPQSHIMQQYPSSPRHVFNNRLAWAQQQASLSQYPPVQGRLGGWIDD